MKCWLSLVKRLTVELIQQEKMKNMREAKTSQKVGKVDRNKEKEGNSSCRDSFCCHSEISVVSRKVSSGIVK